MEKEKTKQETNTQKSRSLWHGLMRFSGRVMGWTLRILLLLVMLVLLVGSATWLFLIKTFNSQQISENLAQRLEEVFDRPVVISSLDLKFFNTVELKGFAVLDNVVEPGTPFLSAESVSIRYELLPLFEHQLIIHEITLNRPRIYMARSDEKGNNIPPIKTAGDEHTLIDKPTGESFQVHIHDWRIYDGIFSYKDLTSGISYAIYHLNMHFKDLHFDELSHFRLSTILRTRWEDNVSEMEIRGTGRVNFANFDWQKFVLQDFKTRVNVFRKPIDLTFNVENLQNPVFTVQAKAPDFSPKDLSVFKVDLPTFYVPASEIELAGRLTDVYKQLQVEKATFKAADVEASAQGKIVFAPAPFTVDVQAKTGWTDLEKFSKYYPALQRFKLKGSGMLSASVSREKGKYTLPEVEISAQKASGSFWGFETTAVSGNFIAKQDFTDLYAQTTDGHVQVAKTSFDKLKMSGSYRKGNVYAYISSALLNEVPLKLRLSINNIKRDSRTIETSIYLKNFDPMKFIGTVGDFVDVILAIGKHEPGEPPREGDLAWMRNFRDRLPEFMPNFAGTLYADTFTSEVLSGNKFNAEFNLTGMLPGGANLNGTLDMKLENGIIHQMEKVAAEQQALNVTFTPFIMLHRMESSGSFKVGEVLKDVAFDEMAASTDFKNGTMIINNAFTHGPIISAALLGWVDWVHENLELSVWTMITPSSRRGILAENLTDENGNPALAFKITSSMLKPRVEMMRAKKTNEQIQTARKRGLRTEFKKSKDFVKGEFNAKK